MKKIFIDGGYGTTGLRIHDRLKKRADIQLLSLKEEEKKDKEKRKAIYAQADIVFLCLPDDASREAVSMAEGMDTIIIDTSTAHRTDERFVYGFPELSKERRAAIAAAKRIASPGCHASGFIALIYPLIEKGILSKSAMLSFFSLTGYSGGGRKMIEQYEDEKRDASLTSPRQYALGQEHKHLKEMKALTGLEREPIFSPIVSSFYSGMQVCIPIFKEQLNFDFDVNDIKNAYKEKYKGPVVNYIDDIKDICVDGFIPANLYQDKDNMGIFVSGNEERILLIAAYDNLGKGASGAAIECMNIAMGVDETTGLNI